MDRVFDLYIIGLTFQVKNWGKKFVQVSSSQPKGAI